MAPQGQPSRLKNRCRREVDDQLARLDTRPTVNSLACDVLLCLAALVSKWLSGGQTSENWNSLPSHAHPRFSLRG